MTSRQWFLGVVVVAAFGLVLGGVSVMAQDTGGAKGAAGQAKPAGGGNARESMQKKMAERNEKLIKAMEGTKVNLAQAITAAEEVAKGKAFTASMKTDKDGKLGIIVRLFVNGKVEAADVDPQTGKATIKEPGQAENEGQEGSGG